MWGFLLCALLGMAVGAPQHAVLAAQTNDATPPSITDVKAVPLTATSITIIWNTDEPSDSMVNVGLDKTYGVVRDAALSPTSHRVTVQGLQSGTPYYFRVISSDSSGNQAISPDYAFTTTGVKSITPKPTGPPTPQTTCPPCEAPSEDTPTVPEDILPLIERITDPELLEQILDRLGELAARIIGVPDIIGLPLVEVGPDYATISWETDKASNSIVYFANESEFRTGLENPYVSSQGFPDEQTVKHVVKVVGLTPSTLYHYQISSKTAAGPVGKSIDRTFTTRSILPEIRNVTLKKVEEHSATIVWVTNVPTKGVVEYTNLMTKEIRSAGVPLFVTTHTLQLTNLEFKTTYTAIVRGENEVGDRVESRPLTFTTTKDEAQPIISRVTNESTLYPGAEAKVQTIVGWETDEPSTCQFYYHEGIADTPNTASFLPEQNPVLRHVQVITSFTPSTIYKFWVECADTAKNKARSEDFVLFTPEKEKSIIDIILENFEGTFGWVKNIGK